MGFEPTTPTLAISGFMCQSSNLLRFKPKPRGTQRKYVPITRTLRGQAAAIADGFRGFPEVVRVMVSINVA